MHMLISLVLQMSKAGLVSHSTCTHHGHWGNCLQAVWQVWYWCFSHNHTHISLPPPPHKHTPLGALMHAGFSSQVTEQPFPRVQTLVSLHILSGSCTPKQRSLELGKFYWRGRLETILSSCVGAGPRAKYGGGE